MYDYRTTKKRGTRRASWHRSLHRPGSSSSVSKSSKKLGSKGLPGTSVLGWIGSLGVWLLGGVVVASMTGYIAVTYLLPRLFPLENLQTILVLPSTQTPQEATMLLFNPEDSSVTVAHLTDGAVPDLAGSLSLAELNRQLGKLMDHVIIVSPDEYITTPPELQKFLRRQLLSKNFGLSQGEKVRLLLFTYSVPKTNIRGREIKGESQWQLFTQQTAKQLSKNACSIALINTTKTSGLGKNISQLLEQSGYQVIKVDSQPTALKFSEVHTSKAGECQSYAQRINNTLIGQPELKVATTQPQLHRADIVIFLGEDVSRASAAKNN